MACVAFIRVDVNLEFEARIDAHEKFVEIDSARSADFQLHVAAIFHAVEFRVIGMHMNVAQRADHALGHFKKSSRPHEHRAGRAFDIAGETQRNFKSQRDGVGVGQFHLIQSSARSEDSKIGDDPATRPDQGQRFLRRELAFLIKPLKRRQSAPRTKQSFDGFLGQVAMSGADIDDQGIRRCCRSRKRLSEASINRLANQVFNHRTMSRLSQYSHTRARF